MYLRLALQTLVMFVLGLPLIQMTLWWIEQLLAALGDTGAVGWLGSIALTLRVLWLATLVGLLIALALDAIGTGSQRSVDEMPE